jgi:hypothetical protein
MSLEQLHQSGRITPQAATAPELLQLLSIVDREISDASIEAVSSDGRFGHAYNAALALCRIAPRASGYRAMKGGGSHSIEINSLIHTMGKPQQEVMVFLSRCSRSRALEVYDHAGVVGAEDVDDLIATAKQLRNDVLAWLKAEHPNLYSP